MRKAIGAAAMLAAAAMAAPAAGEADAPPDPATVTLPDMTPTRDPRVVRNGWRFFYFHKAGVSYAEAYADFADCYRFLPAGDYFTYLPAFRPWIRPFDPGPPPRPAANNYGLIGAAIGSMVAGPIERRQRQSRMRLCLEPRGYVRYPLREEAWRQLIDNYSPRSIAMQARAASGPAPGLEPVTR